MSRQQHLQEQLHLRKWLNVWGFPEFSRKLSLTKSVYCWKVYKSNLIHGTLVDSIEPEHLLSLESKLKDIYDAPVNHGEGCDRKFLLFQPHLFESSGQIFIDMKLGQCHDNVFWLYLFGVVDQMYTGFMLVNTMGTLWWGHHSWGLDNDGTVIETTGGNIPRSMNRIVCYFGVPVPVDQFETSFSVPSRRVRML